MRDLQKTRKVNKVFDGLVAISQIVFLVVVIIGLMFTGLFASIGFFSVWSWLKI